MALPPSPSTGGFGNSFNAPLFSSEEPIHQANTFPFPYPYVPPTPTPTPTPTSTPTPTPTPTPNPCLMPAFGFLPHTSSSSFSSSLGLSAFSSPRPLFSAPSAFSSASTGPAFANQRSSFGDFGNPGPLNSVESTPQQTSFAVPAATVYSSGPSFSVPSASSFGSTGPGFTNQSSFGFPADGGTRSSTVTTSTTLTNNSPFLTPSKTPTWGFSGAAPPSPFGSTAFTTNSASCSSLGGFPGHGGTRSSTETTSNTLSTNSLFLNPSKTPTWGSSGAAQPSPFGFTGFSTHSASCSSLGAFGQKPTAKFTFPPTLDANISATPSSAPLFSSNSGQPPLASQHRGSGIVPYAVTVEHEEVSKEMISISSMRDYVAKSHEELRWEDYQLAKENPFSAWLFSNRSGQPPLASQHGGNGLLRYAASKMDGEDPAKMMSISGMPECGAKSHEELRWEDYQLRTKGGNNDGALNWKPNLFIPQDKPCPFYSPFFQDANKAPTIPHIFQSSTCTPSSSVVANLTCGDSRTHQSPTNSNLPWQPSTSMPWQPLTAPLTNQFPTFTGPQPTASTTTPWKPLTITVAPPSTQLSLTVPSSSPGSNLNGNLCTACGCIKKDDFTFQFQQTRESSPIESPVPADNIVAVKDPFGIQSSQSQLLADHAEFASSTHIGISRMPVDNTPAPSRGSSLLTLRHVSQGRSALQLNIWQPKSDVKKVPFFIREDPHGIPRPVAHPVPREDPKSAFLKVAEPTNDAFSGKPFQLNDASTDPTEATPSKDNAVKPLKTTNGEGSCDDDSKNTSCQLGELHITVEEGQIQPPRDVLPKLTHPEYYTEPLMSELEVKESSDPGFCGRVRGFVIGRHGYGKIEFEGETDVRGLDLDSLVEFNTREVAVYKDESKVAVGEGLNKPAVVTLLNIQCMNKKTGEVYVGGNQVANYTDMLRAAAKRQGAEFVSYNAVNGEWKFRVDHF